MSKIVYYLGKFFVVFAAAATLWLFAGMLSMLPLPFPAFGEPFGIKMVASFSVGGWCCAALCHLNDTIK